MACGVALKRSLDFDPLHGTNAPTSCHDTISTPTAKRRRFAITPRCGSSSSGTTSVLTSSVAPSVWRKYSSLNCDNPSFVAGASSQSPFVNVSKKCSISSEQIVKHIYQEYRRMKKRRQLQAANSPPMSPSSSTMFAEAASHLTAANQSRPIQPLPSVSLDPKCSSSVVIQGKQNVDSPLLSMKQAGIICERLLKEQEDRLRSEFEKALIDKLSEQYDAFVKFSQDQLFQQLQSRPASYVS
ncbi:akirin-2-like [Clavelina lepadiformis]|uniref:akirin-2-like n=1 Tax=Clavelina lepadiformis TaxID=159417 RepID=UPI004041FC86